MNDDKICPNCAFASDSEEEKCRFCGQLLDEVDCAPEQNLVLDVQAKSVAKEAVSVVNIIVGLGIFLFMLAVVLVPNMGRSGARRNARLKSCMANMRVLQGAVEMYNMDNMEMIKYMDDANMQRLIEGKYLRSLPVCPASHPGKYRSAGDLAGEGVISCSVHGTVESPNEVD